MHRGIYYTKSTFLARYHVGCGCDKVTTTIIRAICRMQAARAAGYRLLLQIGVDC